MKSFLLITTLLATLTSSTALASSPQTCASSIASAFTMLVSVAMLTPLASANDDDDESQILANIRHTIEAEDFEVDATEECEYWAHSGECTQNPGYMDANCVHSCRRQGKVDREVAKIIESKIGHINSFFELEAQDIDENTISFDQLRGKVTVITNVASYCGYTESHYRGLVQLNNRFKNSPRGFNILAFPCNQFGEQEPKTCPQIKRFAQTKGVEFTMMNKINVNGLNASPVYLYLKKVAGPPLIKWNFATYFVVAPNGVVASFSGVEPMELVSAILEAMNVEAEEKEL